MVKSSVLFRRFSPPSPFASKASNIAESYTSCLCNSASSALCASIDSMASALFQLQMREGHYNEGRQGFKLRAGLQTGLKIWSNLKQCARRSGFPNAIAENLCAEHLMTVVELTTCATTLRRLSR